MVNGDMKYTMKYTIKIHKPGEIEIAQLDTVSKAIEWCDNYNSGRPYWEQAWISAETSSIQKPKENSI